MTCQYCQTWIVDGEHRCPRCGRRVRSAPSRISPATFPIAATATARAIEPDTDPAWEHESQQEPAHPESLPGQHPLFSEPVNSSRVIAFDSLTTRAERQAIRARAAGLERPAPVKTEKVQLRHAKRTRTHSAAQRTLDFQGKEEVVALPQSNIICDAAVAPPGLRMQAAIVDFWVMLMPCVAGAALFYYSGGRLTLDKQTILFLLIALATVPFLYKFLWAMTGRDSIGMRSAGLLLVDFDGNPPARRRRFQRMFGSFLSLLAVGVGIIWPLVDQDRLTWHDHISGTFPTVEE